MLNNVPTEYIGQARQFWFDLTEHTQQSVSRLTLLIHRTQNEIRPKKNTIRPERFIELAKEWNTYRTDDCRINLTVEMQRKKFVFREYFIAPVPNKQRDSTDIEYAIGVWHINISRDGTIAQPIVTLNIYALAGWIQHTGTELKDVNQVKPDFLPLIDAYNSAKKFAKTRDGGLWLGEYEKLRLVLVNDSTQFRSALNIEAYLSAPMVGLRDIEGYDC